MKTIKPIGYDMRDFLNELDKEIEDRPEYRKNRRGYYLEIVTSHTIYTYLEKLSNELDYINNNHRLMYRGIEVVVEKGIDEYEWDIRTIHYPQIIINSDGTWRPAIYYYCPL